jgi:uncharacterized damage-inducible protein DinB
MSIVFKNKLYRGVMMFIKNQFYTLLEYHWHTTKQLMKNAEKLSQADYFDGIHEILFHILRTDNAWREALTTGIQQVPLSRADCPDLESLKLGFDLEEKAWHTYLGTLSEETLQEEINLQRAGGEEQTFLLWRILQHVVMHGMQHHAEIAFLLSQKGQSPGNIDFLFFQ